MEYSRQLQPGKVLEWHGHGEPHTRTGSLAKWCTGGSSSGPAGGNEWGSCRNKVWPSMTRFGFCFWLLVASLGQGGDQTHWWPGPSICNDGFCSFVLCIFLPLLLNWKPNHIHGTAPGERWQRWDSCKTNRIITPTFTQLYLLLETTQIYSSEHYLDIINQSNLHLVIKHGNKMNFAYNPKLFKPLSPIALQSFSLPAWSWASPKEEVIIQKIDSAPIEGDYFPHAELHKSTIRCTAKVVWSICILHRLSCKHL